MMYVNFCIFNAIIMNLSYFISQQLVNAFLIFKNKIVLKDKMNLIYN